MEEKLVMTSTRKKTAKFIPAQSTVKYTAGRHGTFARSLAVVAPRTANVKLRLTTHTAEMRALTLRKPPLAMSKFVLLTARYPHGEISRNAVPRVMAAKNVAPGTY
jgi:hypothetical protein